MKSLSLMLAVLTASAALLLGQTDAGPVGYLRLMNGPMLGAVGRDHALIWVRGSYRFPVQVEYDTDPRMTSAMTTAPTMLTKERDYCATIRLEGLEPATRYYYRVRIDGRADPYLGRLPPWNFETAPGEGFKGVFRVAFGSCARYQYDRTQEIWRLLPRYDPDLFFWLGDNIYGDSLDPDIIAEEYRRQRDLPTLLEFVRECPQLAIWDDHDYGLNDNDRTNPVKAEMLEVFRRYWPNPSFGLPDTPGVFFSYSYGGVDFFFLDDRYHRDPNPDPDDETKTHLGRAQMQWLLNALERSQAVFKVIVSGGGWSTVKGEAGDSWSAYLHERNRLFEFIQREEITGVVLLSGDTHTAELNVIPWSEKGGYDLYDLVSSPLAQRPGTAWIYRRAEPPETRIRVPYNQSPNFGLLDFDLRGEPTLTFNVIGMDGRPVWQPFVLTAGELRNGVSSWEAKMDRNARRYLGLFPGRLERAPE